MTNGIESINPSPTVSRPSGNGSYLHTMNNGTISSYQFAIANTARHIRSEENRALLGTGNEIRAVDAAVYLGIAFVATEGKVLEDLINYQD